MCKNLEIYNKYRTVPSDAIKPFDNGKFKGTDINTMWRVKCLTECFGVCGFGWTVKVLRTWTEQGATEEVMAFAEVEMRVKLNGEWSEPFTATGGNLMIRYVKGKNGNPGYYTNNDEAFKMAITDAFGVACKYLGIGADVYWSNDRTKYTDQQDKSDAMTQPEKPKTKQTPTIAKNSSESERVEQQPTETKEKPKKAIESPKNDIDRALATMFEGRTLKEIYKNEPKFIQTAYELGDDTVKTAIQKIEAYIQESKK
jgi:hypothetical protein